MATTAISPSHPDTPREVGRRGSTSQPGARRRSPRIALLGLTCAVTFALIFAVTQMRADPTSPVLAMATDVVAGATITADDLTVVRIVAGDGVRVVAASEEDEVIGRTAAVPLVAGSLLTPGHLGSTAWPPVGESVVPVGVTAGHAPSGLVVGSRVTVLVVSTNAASATQGETVEVPRASATVSALGAPDSSGTIVVSLLMDADAALAIGSASGEVTLILQGSGG